MDDRVTRLEASVATLTAEIADLRGRLARLEQPAADVDVADPLQALTELEGTTVQGWLGLVGRTLVVMGGAYLLRALTDAGVWPAPLGVGIGLLYGAPWLLLASRAGARGAHLDALCHGFATALIGYPLVWEATLRFQVLTAPQSAALLAALTSAAFVLSSARDLYSLAAIVTLGALAAGFGLAAATGHWIPYTLLAIGVGLWTLWLGYLRNWTILRWPAALVANVMIVAAAGRAGNTPGPVLIVQLVMLVGYLASFGLRTLVRDRAVIPFEAVQSAGVLVTALGGAILVLSSNHASLLPVGLVTLLLAAGGYAVAFTFVARRRHARNVLYYSFLALALAMVGVVLCAGQTAGSIAYAAMAVTGAALARRSRRQILFVHATILTMGAAMMSGLLTGATLALLAPRGWTVPDAPALVALATAAILVSRPLRDPIEGWPGVASCLRFLLVSLCTWTGMGVAVSALASLLAGGGSVDPALLDTVRTAVLATATVAVARAGREPGGREAGWLMYPFLALTGLKLLVVDFPNGRPSTLFIGLALYGAVLITGPRLMRRQQTIQRT
jgi:hypothetical protein